MEKLTSVCPEGGAKVFLPGKESVADPIGPSATSPAIDGKSTTVRLSAVSAITIMFLLRFAALKAPAVRRTTCPTLTPSVIQEPADLATVQVGPEPVMVIERPVIAVSVSKARRSAAAKKSFQVPAESSPVIAPPTERTPSQKSWRCTEVLISCDS